MDLHHLLLAGLPGALRSTPINRHFQSRSALGKSAKERCPQNCYRDLNPHSPKDALSSGAAFEIQIIAISSLPWIGESRPIPLGIGTREPLSQARDIA